MWLFDWCRMLRRSTLFPSNPCVQLDYILVSTFPVYSVRFYPEFAAPKFPRMGERGSKIGKPNKNRQPFDHYFILQLFLYEWKYGIERQQQNRCGGEKDGGSEQRACGRCEVWTLFCGHSIETSRGNYRRGSSDRVWGSIDYKLRGIVPLWTIYV